MLALVTGASGLLGTRTVRALRRQGCRVRALDRRFDSRDDPAGAERVTADIRDPDAVGRAARGAQAIVHLAAIIPPHSERAPREAESVNVGGTSVVLAAAAAQPNPPLVVFSSSLSVYGPPRASLRRAHEDPVGSDHYTRHKVAAEAMLRASGLPWSIVRVAVAVEPRQMQVDPRMLPTLRSIAPDNRIEWIHPDDVALALSRLVTCGAAWNRVLNLGGGPTCQVRQRDLLAAATDALGLPRVPDRWLGRTPYYTHWLDTADSQAWLDYQRHTFDDFRRELASALGRWRWALSPVGATLRAGSHLLGRSTQTSTTGGGG